MSGENKGASSVQARKFALRSLQKYANVEIPDDELLSWASEGTIDFGDFPRTHKLSDLIRRETDAAKLLITKASSTRQLSLFDLYAKLNSYQIATGTKPSDKDLKVLRQEFIELLDKEIKSLKED